MKKRFLVSLVLLLGIASICSAQWSMNLYVNPSPPAYVSEWETTPGIATLSITYTGDSPKTVKIWVSLTGIVRGDIATGVSDPITFQPGETKSISNTDFSGYSGMADYPPELREQIVRSGRLPEDTYELCCDCKDASTEESYAHQCASFTITAPSPPSLIYPSDDDTILTANPTFQWSAVSAPVGYTVTYNFRLCKVNLGQTKYQAILNIPVDEKQLENLTTYPYPPTATPFDTGSAYVWQVQATDEGGYPIGENDGKSEVWGFVYRMMTYPPEESLVVEETIPEKLPLPDTLIAYVKLRDDDGNILIRFELNGTNLRLYTDTSVTLYIPALKWGDFVPNVGVSFDVTVDALDFSFISGDINAVPPEGVDTLFSLKNLGIPLDIKSLLYTKLAGEYQMLVNSALELPEALKDLSINFDSLRLGLGGLQGSASIGRVFESMEGETFIDSLNLIDIVKLKLNGAEIEFSPIVCKFSGDIVLKIFDNYSSHFVANFGEGGFGFDIDVPEPLPSLPFSEFASLNLIDNLLDQFNQPHPAFALSIGDTFSLELSGELALPFLSDEFAISITGFRIMDKSPYIVCPNIDYPSPEQFANLFGSNIGLDSLHFRYESRVFYIEMAGLLPIFGDTVSFHGLEVGTNGSISIEGVSLISDTIDIFKPYVIIDTLKIGNPTLKLEVGGAIQLPAPFDSIGTQRFRFGIDTHGNITGGGTITLIDSPQEFDFWVGTMRVTHLGLNLDATHLMQSKVLMAAELELKDKVVKLGEDLAKPGLEISFSGGAEGIRWANLDLPFSIPDIDWKVLKLTIDNIDFKNGSGAFGLAFSGGLTLDLKEAVSGSIIYSGFGIDSKGDIDFPHIDEGDLSIANIMTLTVDSIEYSTETTTINIQSGTLPRPTESADSSSKDISVKSYFSFGLNIDIAGIGGGGVDKFLMYEKRGGGTGFLVKNANLGIDNLFKAGLDMEYIGGDGFYLFIAGYAEIIPLNVEVAAVGKISTLNNTTSFGLFVAAKAEIPVIADLLVITQIGGGFFYNPTDSDINIVTHLCGVESTVKDSVCGAVLEHPDPENLKFALFLYGGVELFEVAEGQILLTVTDKYFNLDGKVNIRELENQIYGTMHLGVGFSKFYAEGDIGVIIDVSSLIDARAGFGFFVYSEDVWGIYGNLDADVLTILSLEAELFIGSPGFIISGAVDFGFDIWIIEVSAGFESDIWWVRGQTWGAFAKAYVSVEIFGGIAGAKGWIEGALIGSPRFYIYGAAGLELHVLFFRWGGSVWAKISSGGVNGGFGSDPEMDRLIADARNAAKNMMAARDRAMKAIAEAQIAALALSPEELARAYRNLVFAAHTGLADSLWNLEASAVGYGHHEEPDIAKVYNLVLKPVGSPWILPTPDDTAEVSLTQSDLESAVDELNASKDAASAKLESLMVFIDSIIPAGSYRVGGNPLTNFSAAPPDAHEDASGHKIATSAPGANVDTVLNSSNRATMSSAEEDFQRVSNEIRARIDTLERQLHKIDRLLYSEELNCLPELYQRTDETNDCYFAQSVDLHKKEMAWSQNRLGILPDSTIIASAIQTKTDRLRHAAVGVPENMRWLAFERYRLFYKIECWPNGDSATNKYNKKVNEINSLLSEWSDDTTEFWAQICNQAGVQVWWGMPYYGLNAMGSTADTLLDTIYVKYEMSDSTILGPHRAYTEAIDEVYAAKLYLTETLYDLYDRYIFWIAGHTETLPEETGEEGFGITPPGIPPGGWWTPPQVVLPDVRSTLERYIENRDTLFYELTVPHISRISIYAENLNFYDDVDIRWHASHPKGIRDYGYKIARRGYPHYLYGYQIATRNSLKKAFIQLGNEKQRDYTLWLRARGGAGYTIRRSADFSIYFEDGGRGPGHGSSFRMNPDTTPPWVSDVNFPHNFYIALGPHGTLRRYYTSDKNEIYVEWKGGDYESGIEEYQYEVTRQIVTWSPMLHRYFESEETVLPFRSSGGMDKITIRGLELEHGNTYLVKVKAKNDAGLWSGVASSRPLYVDTTPPSTPTLHPVCYLPPVWYLGPVAPPSTGMCWNEARDNESGIRKYWYCLDTIPHPRFDVTGWNDTTPDVRKVQFVGSPVAYLDTFYISVVAENYAQEVSDFALVSRPLTPVDFSAPTMPEFRVWPRPQFITSLHSMRIWVTHLSSDLETGIKGYQYALGTTYSNPTNVREWPGWMDFVIADTIRDRVPTLRGLKNLNHGGHYYIAVRAVNGYGTHSDYYVRDFVVDTVPPPPLTLNSFTYKRDTLILDITVYEDDGSELEVVQLSIGSKRGRENILQSRSIGTTTGHRKYIQPIHLISGRRYWLCLKARDKAGLRSENWIPIVP